MIAMERSYDGDDPLLLAALAVVVHALESILAFLTRARRDWLPLWKRLPSYYEDSLTEVDREFGDCGRPVEGLTVGGVAIALQFPRGDRSGHYSSIA